MSISLALSPDRGRSQSGMGKWHDPNVTKPQYMEHIYGLSHFPGPDKYKKRHGFYFYPLYADTVPLMEHVMTFARKSHKI